MTTHLSRTLFSEDHDVFRAMVREQVEAEAALLEDGLEPGTTINLIAPTHPATMAPSQTDESGGEEGDDGADGASNDDTGDGNEPGDDA